MAGSLPRYQDLRWQSAERQIQTNRQSGSASPETRGVQSARQPVGVGRLLPALMWAHGQTESDYRYRPQTRAHHLLAADPGPGIRGPRTGLLRRTLPEESAQ